jgi:hypothetical protein
MKNANRPKAIVTVSRHPVSGRSLLACGIALCAALSTPLSAQAAFIQGRSASEVLIGADDDNLDNPVIQPEGVEADQSLSNTDVIAAGKGNDVVIGLLGGDVLHGDKGHDVLIGGPEQGTRPNSDVAFGGTGSDIFIWAPGDGSDAFIGGSGRDALVFGVIDRDADNVPTLSGPQPGFRKGLPSAEVTNSPGFCTVERVEDRDFGFRFLVRFFVRATGNLAVTLRVRSVEQVFCTTEEGGEITFADLRDPVPEFIPVTLDEVRAINRRVARIIR